MNDPYQILNIPPTATDEEVKRAYRDRSGCNEWSESRTDGDQDCK